MLVEARAKGQAGDHAGAEALYRCCLAQEATVAAAWSGLGTALKRQAKLAGAADAYARSLALDDNLAASHTGLAEVLLLQGKLQEALERCCTGIGLESEIGEGHIVRAYIYKNLGDLKNAAADLSLVIKRNPLSIPTYLILCDIYDLMDCPDRTVAVLEKAVAIEPHNDTLKVRLAQALAATGHVERGAKILNDAVLSDPKNIDKRLALATFYLEQGQGRHAFDTFCGITELDPACFKAYMGLAQIATQEYNFALATSINEIITKLKPGCPVALYNLGIALTAEKRLEEAASSFRNSIAADPTFTPALVELGWAQARTCDWRGLKDLQLSSLKQNDPIQPFILMTYAIETAERQLKNAHAWVARFTGGGRAKNVLRSEPRAVRADGRRIRLGYVSCDFYNHATVALMIGLLECHDRAAFEVVAYSFGPNDQSQLRDRLIKSVDSFVDVRTFSDKAIAALIRKDDIDIVIDLKGYTLDSRTGIFATRPAPIQINYLGYPGTMGGNFIDYIIADPVVAPMEHASCYSEKIVHLPHTYQPNDRMRPRPPQPTRQECGLPDGAFVFCCFNNNYKITEEMFSVWMRILLRTEGSVLWLLEASSPVKANLRREAEARGVDPGRLIFAPYVPVRQHLARIGAADLFLDTLPYNAHTTASEALWVGLPVLTCMGDSFAGRVAASLIRAIGVPELVTTSVATYEQRAVEFADDPAQLAQLRQRINENRMSHPLFDIARYTKNFEKSLQTMIQNYNAGCAPRSFAVVEEAEEGCADAAFF